MKKRVKYIIFSISALLLGLGDYLIFRKDTYLHSFLKTPQDFGLSNISFMFDEFVTYALPDLFWSFSLAMALIALYMPEKRGVSAIVAAVSFFGIAWETAQLIGITSGTFDLIDCGMYIISSVSAGLIYCFIEKLFRRDSL